MAVNWYIVHAHTGFEKKVAQQVKESALQNGLSERVCDVFVPSGVAIEVRKGKKVEVEKKYFPGYVLLKADMNDEVWHMVKSLPKVTGFLGSGSKPQPISEVEMQRIYDKVEEQSVVQDFEVVFEIGEEVKVSDGPFESFTGVVEEVDDERSRLKVSVSIFGRATPVDLEYNQVEKLS